MTKAPDTKARTMPSPEWNALSREEQIARYRDYLAHPDCKRVSKASMTDVLIAARERVAARNRG